ncbi:MAG TPA: M20/M25/M40 family metallo-hydrolase [Thermoanaerobaculia bacterium]|jgi:acetylornithine deacetylase/succinyl-diaminopimelate desuccinylase-like protein
MIRRFLLSSLLLFAACQTATTTTSAVPDVTPRIAPVRELMAREDIVKALAFVDADRETLLRQWEELTEIPAPSGHEQKRADYVERLLREYGLEDVHRDAVGNVIGTYRGTGGGKRVVFDSHLDTVFPMNTPIDVKIENGRIAAPGVGDDTKNAISMLAQIRAMKAGGVQTKGDVVFVFTVREETDFGGVNQFLADNAKSIDRYVTLDGGYRGFTYGGIGIYWYRYHFIGPGGHTRSDTPPYSATLPVARAIDRIYQLKLPRSTWMNIGMLGAGDVFNAKAPDAWFTADLRSNNQESLLWLDREVERIANEEAKRAGMTVKRDVDSKSDVASLPGHRSSEMVQQVEAVWRAVGFDNPPITDTASNHTSAALLAGVPAIGTGTGPCEHGHALDEVCEIEPVFAGTKRNVVLAVVLAE